MQFLEPFRDESGIVYCLSRKRCESIADFLRGEGHNALVYHAGLSSEERARAQSRFLREDSVIMVATIAFGMGIDKPDIRFVAHMNIPKSLESFYQGTGRAGRDGNPAEALLLYGYNDIVQLRSFIDNSDSEENYKHNSLL